MSRDGNHIDNYFRDGLNDLEISAPDDVWGKIEERLDRKRRAGIISLWTGLAAGLALLIGIGIYMRYSPSNQKTTQSAQLTVPLKHNQTSIAKPTEKEILTANTISSSDASQPKDNSSHTTQANSMIVIKANIPVDSQSGNTENTNENSAGTETPSDKDTFVPNDNLLASTQNKDASMSYLSPLGATLPTHSKSALIVHKENTTDVTHIVEPDPIFPDMAETPTVQKINRWSIAGQVAPQYSYRNSSQSSTTGQNNEAGLVAYSGGLKVDYKTSRRFSIQTGVYYSVMGQTQNNVKIAQYPNAYQSSNSSNTRYVLSTSNSMGPIVNSNSSSNQMVSNTYYDNIGKTNITSATYNTGLATSTQDGSIIQELKFIEVPVLARYKLIDKKIGLHLIGGVSTNFLVKNEVILKQATSNENIGKTEGLNTINYSGTLGFGINYQLLKKIDLSIEPTYKYYLNSISTSKEFNYHPYAFGIFTGVTYKF